ncbi:NAD-dependent epimerase/dehydratase family protein [Candidatus Pelagibacter sp.]|nr:NAD-dependent epimerase/dehydratase family protein [Candidatus Pelagibacter sp.]
MSVVLITGSHGLVGSESCFFFLKKGYEVIGIDNNIRKRFFGNDGNTNWIKKRLNKIKNYKHYNFDIRDEPKLKKLFHKYNKNISIIIHAAAQPSHDYAKDNIYLDFEINTKGSLNIFDNAHKFCPRAKIIHLSTNKVYGDNPNKFSFVESKTRIEPVNKKIKINGFDENLNVDNSVHSFFGISKIYSDMLAQEYGKIYGLKIGIFRAGCLTGPNHSGASLHGFLSYLIKSCMVNRQYNIIGFKGKQVRDNLHSFDLINAFWEFIKKPKKGEVYNIGGGKYSNCSILEALNYIKAKTKNKIEITFNNSNRIGDHIWYISDLTKFKKDYPKWTISYKTKSIINEIIDKYK